MPASFRQDNEQESVIIFGEIGSSEDIPYHHGIINIMIPLRLRIAGFLSYHDPVELDFTGFDLACISGSNGAGKSSLLDAITWALFGQARRRDEALINLQSKVAEVTLTFQYEGCIYRIQRALPRGKNGILEFQILEAAGCCRHPGSQAESSRHGSVIAPSPEPRLAPPHRTYDARDPGLHRRDASSRLRDLRQRLLLSPGQGRSIHPADRQQAQGCARQHSWLGGLGTIQGAHRRPAQEVRGRSGPARPPHRRDRS